MDSYLYECVDECPEDRPLLSGYYCVEREAYDRDTPTWNGSACVSCRNYNSSEPCWDGSVRPEPLVLGPHLDGDKCANKCPSTSHSETDPSASRAATIIQVNCTGIHPNALRAVPRIGRVRTKTRRIGMEKSAFRATTTMRAPALERVGMRFVLQYFRRRAMLERSTVSLLQHLLGAILCYEFGKIVWALVLVITLFAAYAVVQDVREALNFSFGVPFFDNCKKAER